MKTPEEYFQEKVALPDEAQGDGRFTPAEQAFLDKYLGCAEGPGLKRLGLDKPVTPETVAGFGPASAPAPAPAPAAAAAATTAPRQGTRTPVLDKNEIEDLEAYLRAQSEIKLVSFFLGRSEFALPISVIQEVIRFVQPTRLPSAPPFLAGMVNLRGRVTPLVHPRLLMGGAARGEGDDDRFIVVCRRRGLQVGLIIQAVATMYHAAQKDIEWSIETNLGVSADFLLGLMKQGEKLVSIISIDRLIDKVLRN